LHLNKNLAEVLFRPEDIYIFPVYFQICNELTAKNHFVVWVATHEKPSSRNQSCRFYL